MKCVSEQIFVVCSLRTDFMELAADSFSYCLIFTHLLYIKHFNEKWALARRLVKRATFGGIAKGDGDLLIM